jgi:transposase
MAAQRIPISTPQQNTPAQRQEPAKPKVVIVCLQDSTFLDSEMYKSLRRLLHHFTDHAYCETTRECQNAITMTNPPHAVIVLDAGIVHNREVTNLCAAYLRRGGRLIFAGSFTSYMPKSVSVRRFFQNFGVWWTFDGVEQRNVEVEIVDAVVGRSQDHGERGARVVKWSLMHEEITFGKTHVLDNVRPEDAPYVVKEKPMKKSGMDVDDEDSKVGSEDDALVKSGSMTKKSKSYALPRRVKTPIAWSRQSLGSVGVICDNYISRDTEAMILAMAGLLPAQ